MMKLKEIKTAEPTARRNGGGNGGGRYWHDGGGREYTPPIPNAKFAMMLVCVASVMLFVALTGAYIVVRFSGAKWPPAGFPPLPRGLWLNTGIILASSATLLFAQRAFKRGNLKGVKWGLLLTTLLGAAFLVRQVAVWNQLTLSGVRMSSGVYGSVFYSLTLIHALHVLGGLIFLAFVTIQSWRARIQESAPVEVCAIYWHFVDALWLYLFTILYVM